ncbi:MAG: class I SAM-dependent methyltransferase [Hyphomicrobiales bacterium]|nr:class I SAM-dependent methyltransferase [Hyphomicrobiales bacterium]
MDYLQLLTNFHKNATRQGPGGDAETRMAITLSGLRRSRDLRIADIGCGTGAPTLILAEVLDANITAIDFLPEFLTKLEIAAQKFGVADRVKTAPISMEALPFGDGELDAIWSEGAIYNIGFETGIKQWRKFLKPGGILAVSEITWLTEKRPRELEAHWQREYPQINTAANKLAVLQKQGFTPVGYFVLPEHCWLDNYYQPMQQRFATFLEDHDNSAQAQAIVAAEKAEIKLYEQYKEHFGYCYYIARKIDET